MKSRPLLGVFLTVLLVAGCRMPTTPETRQVVRFAVLPAYSLDVMAKKYVPFMEYLSRETGLKVEYVSSLSYGDYLAVVEGSRVDFGLQNALIFQILRKTRGAYPLAQVVGLHGSAVERGVIITNENSGIQEIGQLRGKRIMATSKRALAGYLAQAVRLREVGIDLERDVRMIPGGRQDELLLKSLLEGKVDAAFVREDVLKAVKGRGNLARIRVIGYTDYVPTWCLAAFKETDPSVVAKVQQAVLKLSGKDSEDARILNGVGALRFIPTSPESYEKVLELTAALGFPLQSVLSRTMHEMSLATRLVATAVHEARRRALKQVRVLHVRLGGLWGAEPASLEFQANLLAQGTPLGAAHLKLEVIPIVVRCRCCGMEVRDSRLGDPGFLRSLAHGAILPEGLFCCPGCETSAVTIEQGRELEVVAMEG